MSHVTIGLSYILRRFWRGISVTFIIVLGENLLISLIPLLIGLAIDGLLAGRREELVMLGVVLLAAGALAVGRRLYDTRVYGGIRLHIGHELNRRSAAVSVSARAARLQMSRELVDFFEHTLPELTTACIQLVVSFVVLVWFAANLGLTAAGALVLMLLLYGLFHRAFFRLNAALNSETEKRVTILSQGLKLSVFRHLRAIRSTEVALSDHEAALYGGIFALQMAVILMNLLQAAALADITAGAIFSIATYSWEFVEAALLLPMALQGWSRLSEIIGRLNTPAPSG